MVTLVLALTVLHLLADRQIVTLTAESKSNNQLFVSFASTKWQPVDDKSLVVDSFRNYSVAGELLYTYRRTHLGTVPRATATTDGVVPGCLMVSWTTYRAVKEVGAAPTYVFSNKQNLGQVTARCWDMHGEAATGKVGQSLEAHLRVGNQALFSCQAMIAQNKDGKLSIICTVRNESAQEATFEWGTHKATVKAGKTAEYTLIVKPGTTPKEADWKCNVTFGDNVGYVFKANAWIVP